MPTQRASPSQFSFSVSTPRTCVFAEICSLKQREECPSLNKVIERVEKANLYAPIVRLSFIFLLVHSRNTYFQITCYQQVGDLFLTENLQPRLQAKTHILCP